MNHGVTFITLVSDLRKIGRQDPTRNRDFDRFTAADGEDARADVEFLSRSGAHLDDGVDGGVVGEFDGVGDDTVVGFGEVEFGCRGGEHYFIFL